jgi:hypothetical protein
MMRVGEHKSPEIFVEAFSHIGNSICVLKVQGTGGEIGHFWRNVWTVYTHFSPLEAEKSSRGSDFPAISVSPVCAPCMRGLSVISVPR